MHTVYCSGHWAGGRRVCLGGVCIGEQVCLGRCCLPSLDLPRGDALYHIMQSGMRRNYKRIVFDSHLWQKMNWFLQLLLRKCKNLSLVRFTVIVIHSYTFLTELSWQVLIEGYLTSLSASVHQLSLKAFDDFPTYQLSMSMLVMFWKLPVR